jgi:DNA-binding transcriptional MocR family regulator
MTGWLPDLAQHRGPRYRAIADALAADISSGRLTSGQRLPTHRDLAYQLHVTVGTVSRAYAEAERRGLIGGEIGRGTFVRARGEIAASPAGLPSDDEIDFALNAVVSGGEAAALADTLAELARDPALGRLLAYLPHVGLPEHRTAAARLLRALEIDVSPERIVLTSGAQHAMVVALTALAHPGDTIACEQLTYAGIKSVTRLLHLRVKPIAMDGDGILPDAFEAACRESDLRALYLCPTLQNPTGSTLSLERRKAIVAIAARHDVRLIEDDVYGFLAPGAPSTLVALAPERVLYINGTSKCLAPGLRIGFLVVPPDLVGRIANGVRTTVWMATPLMAEVVRRWVDAGVLMRFIEEKRRLGRERQATARRILGATGVTIAPTHANALHLWMALPEPWTDEAFAAEARRNGVLVTAGTHFAIGRPPLDAVRLALGSPPRLAEVEHGLDTLACVLRGAAEPMLSIV